jgi:prophage regulatory protein
MADDDAGKWARAQALADEEDALHEQYQQHKYNQALSSRFAKFGRSAVLHMFKEVVNEKGAPLSQFEFEALCERWCEVFGELPPFGAAPAVEQDADPLPPDDALLRMRDVVRITGLSKSTIKRWVGAPENDFPKPVKLSPRRIAWRANQVKAWRRKIEDRLSSRAH